jgi:hypothetical protein
MIWAGLADMSALRKRSMQLMRKSGRMRRGNDVLRSDRAQAKETEEKT